MDKSNQQLGIAALKVVTYRTGRFLYFLLGMSFMLIIWHISSLSTDGELPGPTQTFSVFYDLVSHPFFDHGPNDKGIGNQLLSSLERVTKGFIIGSLIAIPLGLIMGSSTIGMNLLNPMVQVLRPVSPLAWFPIGLVAFQSAQTSTVFVIIITSLWPTLINTAFGVSTIPQDHKNVAKAFGFSNFKYITKVLLPFTLPHIITGLRLSVGIAWMVIVAAEMLSGGVGIGFFVWDSWNALSLEKVFSAILIIGLVGFVLDKSFKSLQTRYSYDG
ncbi:nitrate ABC transporter permease [Sporocytophaga myxococcoides]|uniref:Nitrate ABC transporter permease n=1 Tax=Sporocytophaga myxococcoides TaxID=153721 RepID=A0A098L8B5_9BACT|nr:nitrate ABC transporter permease [Sporocytophaga myxococcoides]GAL82920.1 nitrate ABC transporter permease [Sporocytophaga myxococcoides]